MYRNSTAMYSVIYTRHNIAASTFPFASQLSELLSFSSSELTMVVMIRLLIQRTVTRNTIEFLQINP